MIEKALKRTFSPEFLNRVDDVVIFNHLSEENIFSIIDILMKGVTKRLDNLGLTLELTEEAKKFISDKGFDAQFGARPLHRAIQKYLEDPLAEEILNMNVKSGDLLMASLDKENSKIIFEIKGGVKNCFKISATIIQSHIYCYSLLQSNARIGNIAISSREDNKAI